MNKVIVLGRAVKDPEVRYAENSDKAIAKFNIAINKGKDKNGNVLGADFPQVTVFGKQAENCERFLAKGGRVLVEGRITTSTYEKDGVTKYNTGITATRIEFIDFKGDNNATDDVSGDIAGGFEFSDEDIPF